MACVNGHEAKYRALNCYGWRICKQCIKIQKSEYAKRKRTAALNLKCKKRFGK